jgi:polyferredoxin
VQEWIGRAGRKVFGRHLRLPSVPDKSLMLLRYVGLIAIPVLTYTVWQYDLGFRAYDPFYVLFTWGGHEIAAFSVYIVIGVLAAAFFIRFAWCRYLCPLGAMMDPLSRAGGFRLRRNNETCTDCGKCDRACPHAIPVSTVKEVTARNCTNCLECVEECPVENALELAWFGK